MDEFTKRREEQRSRDGIGRLQSVGIPPQLAMCIYQMLDHAQKHLAEQDREILNHNAVDLVNVEEISPNSWAFFADTGRVSYFKISLDDCIDYGYPIDVHNVPRTSDVFTENKIRKIAEGFSDWVRGNNVTYEAGDSYSPVLVSGAALVSYLCVLSERVEVFYDAAHNYFSYRFNRHKIDTGYPFKTVTVVFYPDFWTRG